MPQAVAKFCVNRPCAHIPFVFSVGHGKSDQPLARERLLTSLLKQPFFLPLLHTHNFKTNVHLWCKICWSICFFLGALEKCDQCDEYVWVCLETVCARGWVQYSNLQELLFIPMSRSILSFLSPPPQPVPWDSTEYEGCTAIRQPKGAPWKALVCVGLSHRSCSVLTLVNPQSHPEELQSRRVWGLWMAEFLFRMASCRCAGSLFWAVSVWVILWEFSKVYLPLLTVPLEIWIFPTCL